MAISPADDQFTDDELVALLVQVMLAIRATEHTTPAERDQIIQAARGQAAAVVARRLKGLGRAGATAWSLTYLERVDLADKASIRIDKLSGGQQQKIQLGVTIMNAPELLILDEPTQGFDPVNRRLLMDIIEEQKRAGATVIMVTHQMDEVERLCDRIILLKDGTAEAYGTVADVQNRYGGTVVRVQYSGQPQLPASDLYDVVTGSAGSTDLGGTAELAPRGGADESAILTELVRHGVQVHSFTTARTSLEEIFLKVYGSPNELVGA